jgi:ketosteroid isomerase-like protein
MSNNHSKETEMASSAARVEAVMEERAAAMAARDIERLMAVYTTDIV